MDRHNWRSANPTDDSDVFVACTDCRISLRSESVRSELKGFGYGFFAAFLCRLFSIFDFFLDIFPKLASSVL